MSNTPLLKLPEIVESQASKFITHNEALRRIEAILVRVLSRSVDDETTLSPSDGDSYIVAAASFAIVGVDTSGEVFRISGDQTGRMNVGESIEVSGSTGNDGTYTIDALNYDSNNDETDITVQEDVTDSTADGEVLHAAGAFNGHRDDVAYYHGGAWSFVTPIEGFGPLWVNDEDVEVRFVDSTAGAAVWLKTTLALDDLGSAATKEADQNLRTSDAPNFGGATITATQYGYLGALGSAPLEDDDLAANGGSVPEVDRENTFTAGQRHVHLSSDPADPASGESVHWTSDGTGSGNAGDLMRKVNVGGTVKTQTIIAY